MLDAEKTKEQLIIELESARCRITELELDTPLSFHPKSKCCSSHHESLVRLYELEINTLQDLFDFALEQALVLTRSAIGYIYFFDETTSLFSLYSWSSDVMKECRVTEKKTTYCLESTGLWGEAVRQRKAIVVNNFAEHHSFKKGYPKGHVVLFKYLTLPIFESDKIVAVIGVGNKDANYTELDVKQLDLFAKGVWVIAKRKEAEEALRESKLRLEFALEGSGDGVWDLDIAKNTLFFSKRCKSMLGHEDCEIGNDPNEWKSRVHPDELAGCLKHLYRHFRGETSVYEREHRLRCKNGSYKWVLSRGKVIQRNGDGGPLRVIGTMADITERKKIESLKEEVDKIMRHDLRSPLLGIVGLPELLLEKNDLKTREREILLMIQESGHKVLSMIDNSLAVYKMELGSYALNPVSIDVVSLVVKAKSRLSTQFKYKKVKFLICQDRICEKCENGFLVEGEELLCCNMLSNLLLNAAEASPPEENVCINLSTAHPSIKIVNKGCVPIEIRERFFDKYVTAGKKNGTGLGTYSAALIAKTHGWNIRLDTSVPGETAVIVEF